MRPVFVTIDFVTGVGRNALKKDEILLGVRFDKPAARTAVSSSRTTSNEPRVTFLDSARRACTRILAAQREDLRKAERDLQAIIAEINRTSRDLFTATFDAVQKQFNEIFRKCFGGGMAELVLEDGADGTLWRRR